MRSVQGTVDGEVVVAAVTIQIFGMKTTFRTVILKQNRPTYLVCATFRASVLNTLL